MDITCKFCGTKHEHVEGGPDARITCQCGRELTGVFSMSTNKLVEDVSRAFRRGLLRSFSSQDLLGEVSDRIDDQIKAEEAANVEREGFMELLNHPTMTTEEACRIFLQNKGWEVL